MATISDARILSISIERAAHDAYEFLANPENLPKWATQFCKAVRKDGDQWIVRTSHAEVGVRFVQRNVFGVVDHYVTPKSGDEVYVPLRVVPNESGSEVMLTIFRPKGMPGDELDETVRMVKADLQTLKQQLENDAVL